MRGLLSVLALTLLGTSLPAADPAAPPPRTLGRVFARLNDGQPVTVAYFGGSITAAAGYRVKTFAWLKDRFPKATLKEVNAAIGGTGSDLGAFRCAADVLAHRPDLVFVEFNINDGSPSNTFRKATMEGIVRQLWASPGRPEIVFLYTTSRTLNHPRVSHPAVARHYRIPEIDLQPTLLAALKRKDLPRPTEKQLADPRLDWKAPGQVFMSDSVHPNDLGHTLYAETIIAYLKTQLDAAPSPEPTLGRPLVSEEFAHVRMVKPTEAKWTGDWEVLAATVKPGLLARYKEGTINARKPGDALEFAFEGTALGLFLNVQKDGGKFEWTIDDGKNLPAERGYGGPLGVKRGVVDTAPGPYFARNHYALLSCGLPPGKHVLRLRVLDERHPTSSGNRLLIGYFLVGGGK